MKQLSITNAERAAKNQRKRRETFLAEMEVLVPWSRSQAVIEPLYRTSGCLGRQPIRVSQMLRICCPQQWYVVADEALENALHELPVRREFVHIDLGFESAPDATMLLKIWPLPNDLTRAMSYEINAHLAERGLLICDGTIVDVTIIAAPPSTKIKDHVRDPDKHQTKKGARWHFGMKLVLSPVEGARSEWTPTRDWCTPLSTGRQTQLI